MYIRCIVSYIKKWPPDFIHPTGVYTKCHAPGGIMIEFGSGYKHVHEVIALTESDQVPEKPQIL